MKLLTLIQPRRAGNVVVREGDAVYNFEPGPNGNLVCDVDDDAEVAKLLATGNFEPADESDYERADLLLASGDAGDDVEDEGDEGDDGDEGDEDAMPVEANTPPVAAARPRKPGRPRKG